MNIGGNTEFLLSFGSLSELYLIDIHYNLGPLN